jgi:sugar O-acyltransferase (sialic acid O-acetyltransferase NeuD family)
MIIVGAKGFANEILEILNRQGLPEPLYFFDNVSKVSPDLIAGRFRILRSFEEAETIFAKEDRQFLLGVGNPGTRFNLCRAFEKIGGTLSSLVSKDAFVGSHGVVLGDGCVIMMGAVVTTNITLGKGCLINYNATVGHDTIVGDFTEISPGANVSGRCKIGDYCLVGANAVILPDMTLGKNVIVGAGSVVTKDVPDNSLVVGVPAAIRRKLDPVV